MWGEVIHTQRCLPPHSGDHVITTSWFELAAAIASQLLIRPYRRRSHGTTNRTPRATSPALQPASRPFTTIKTSKPASPSSPTRLASAGSYTTRVRTSACSLTSSFPQRRSRIHNDHCAANGTTILTHGWLPLSLIWDDAGNPRVVPCSDPRHTTPRRRTPATNQPPLWHQTSP
jgi:hypothetical protein